jgi:hypothetical protein
MEIARRGRSRLTGDQDNNLYWGIMPRRSLLTAFETQSGSDDTALNQWLRNADGTEVTENQRLALIRILEEETVATAAEVATAAAAVSAARTTTRVWGRCRYRSHIDIQIPV